MIALIMSSRLSTLFLTLVIYVSFDKVSGKFPLSVYDGTGKWKVTSPDTHVTKEHAGQMFTFRDNTITVRYMQNPFEDIITHELTYTFVKHLGDLKYIVTKQESMHTEKFLCIQFLFRSKNVIQLKFGPLKKYSTISCDELRLMNAPLVYYQEDFHNISRNKHEPFAKCPFDGGFIAHWYNETGHSFCRNTIPPLKIENRCTKDEGLLFHTLRSYAVCPFPESGFMLLRDNYQCLASWSDETNTYAVLVKEQADGRMFSYPCLRIPNEIGESFEALVFIDGACETAVKDVLPEPPLRIRMRKHPIDSECQDETRSCKKLTKVGVCTDEASRYCRKSCKMCSMRRGFPAMGFNLEFVGSWLRHVSKDDEGVERWRIIGGVITIDGVGDFKVIGKHKCGADGEEASFSGVGASDIHEYHLLSNNWQNGCSPRMMRILLVARSSEVLSYRTSSSMIAELDSGPTWHFKNVRKKICQGANFNLDEVTSRLESSRRTGPNGWFNLVRDDMAIRPRNSKAEEVNCNFPDDFPSHFALDLPTHHRNGKNKTKRCSVKINRQTISKFILLTGPCSGETIDPLNVSKHGVHYVAYYEKAKQAHKCLASYSSGGQTFVITRAHPEGATMTARRTNFTLTCWVFDSNTREVLWLPASDCDERPRLHVTKMTSAKEKAGGPVAVIDFRATPVQFASNVVRATHEKFAISTHLMLIISNIWIVMYAFFSS